MADGAEHSVTRGEAAEEQPRRASEVKERTSHNEMVASADVRPVEATLAPCITPVRVMHFRRVPPRQMAHNYLGRIDHAYPTTQRTIRPLRIFGEPNTVALVHRTDLDGSLDGETHVVAVERIALQERVCVNALVGALDE